MELVKRLWKYFMITLPIWLVMISGVLLYWGYKLESDVKEEAAIQKILYTIASATLSGGVFAAVLKAMQFMNVFQNALEKIVLTDKTWLATLSTSKLRKIWQDVIKTMVLKGFPELSDKLTDEVFEHVVPKLGDYYYSNMKRRIEIESYDKSTDTLNILEQYELTINSHSKDTKIPYNFELKGDWPADMDLKPYEITHLEINGKDFLSKVMYPGRKGEYQVMISHCIPLVSQNEYKVLRNMRRTTRPSKDPVFHMVAARFTDGMTISIQNRAASSVKLRPLAIGVKKLEISTQAPDITRCEVKQLLFPGDGLILVIEKV